MSELTLIPSPGLSEVRSVLFFSKPPQLADYVFVALCSPCDSYHPVMNRTHRKQNHILFVSLFAYAFIFLTLWTPPSPVLGYFYAHCMPGPE